MFEIPTPRMPTDQEIADRGAGWLKQMGPFLMERWSPELMAISVPTQFIELPAILVDQWWGANPIGWTKEARNFSSKIDAMIGWDGVFFKLNTRSPKDAMYPSDACISWSGKHILSVLRGSERVLDDCVAMQGAGVQPLLCLRDVVPEMKPARELRCFIKSGEILAVAEYGREPVAGWPKSADAAIRARVDSFLVDVVFPHLPVDTIVVDLWFRARNRNDEHEFGVIEINPYGLSDPVGAQNYQAIEAGIDGIARNQQTG